MFRHPIFAVSVIVLLGQLVLSVDLQSLRLVQVVYRHGDRSPLKSYPTDPYKDVDKYWPMGLSQLTEKGKDQQFQLGRYLRRRYNGFMSSIYHRKQIHVLSSDTDRTLQSAEANLAGLYPKLPVNATEGRLMHTANARVDVQLVPIHTLMQSNDKVLKMTAKCPKRSILLNEFTRTSESIQEVMKNNQGLYEHVRENAGYDVGTDFFVVMRVEAILHCQEVHNLQLPDWVNSTVMERMRALRGVSLTRKGGTPELRRLYGGPLVKRLLDNMYQVKETKNKHRKMYMHSAHDDTLAAVMSTLGVFNDQVPPYASLFIAELHKENLTGKYYVELFYRNTTVAEPYPLQIPGCASPCYLSDLIHLLDPVVPVDWERECRLLTEDEPDMGRHHGIVSVVYFLAVIGTLILVWLTVLCLVLGSRNYTVDDSSDGGKDRRSYIKLP